MILLSPDSADGQPPENSILLPSKWFAKKFPTLVALHGDAVLEKIVKEKLTATAMNEDFLAATLGEKGCPHAPTVFYESEQRFYTYAPTEGIFMLQPVPVLTARLSDLLLECARASQGSCDTRDLEFGLRSAGRLAGVIKKAEALLLVRDGFFASDLTKLIPCANGMLDVSKKLLLEFDPKYRRRNKLAVPFDGLAQCPLFLETLMLPALDADDLDLIQRACGLFLVGENLAQKIFILTGTAGGGKGTFVRVLQGIVGETNITALRTQFLTERFETARFMGKTLLYGADVPRNFLNQRGAPMLKSLTGADPTSVEYKNSNSAPLIVCRFNVVVTCNSRLTVSLEGDAEAWRRRLVIVEYSKPKPASAIADLDKRILATEASGVLNWMLEGLDKLLADNWRLHLTPGQQRRVDDLLLESDSTAVFTQECILRDATGKLTSADCYAAYAEYCHKRGWAPLPRNKFSTSVEELLAREFAAAIRNDILDAHGKSQQGWKGIRVRNALDHRAGDV